MMHCGNWTSLPLICALLLSACGRDEPSVSAPAVPASAGANAYAVVQKPSASRAASFAELVAGTDYVLVDPAPPDSSTDASIAVAEAFSYACSHCADFEPVLAAWVAKLPADVSFEAVPMPLSDVWTEFARAHYAAQDLNLGARTHSALFDALHTQGARIDSVDALVEWFSTTGGVDAAAFRKAMTSPGTDARVEGARARAQRWGVDSTPTLVIDDRYKVPGFANAEGGFQRTLAVADLLLAELRKSRAPST